MRITFLLKELKMTLMILLLSFRLLGKILSRRIDSISGYTHAGIDYGIMPQPPFANDILIVGKLGVLPIDIVGDSTILIGQKLVVNHDLPYHIPTGPDIKAERGPLEGGNYRTEKAN